MDFFLVGRFLGWAVADPPHQYPQIKPHAGCWDPNPAMRSSQLLPSACRAAAAVEKGGGGERGWEPGPAWFVLILRAPLKLPIPMLAELARLPPRRAEVRTDLQCHSCECFRRKLRAQAIYVMLAGVSFGRDGAAASILALTPCATRLNVVRISLPRPCDTPCETLFNPLLSRCSV